MPATPSLCIIGDYPAFVVDMKSGMPPEEDHLNPIPGDQPLLRVTPEDLVLKYLFDYGRGKYLQGMKCPILSDGAIGDQAVEVWVPVDIAAAEGLNGTIIPGTTVLSSMTDCIISFTVS